MGNENDDKGGGKGKPSSAPPANPPHVMTSANAPPSTEPPKTEPPKTEPPKMEKTAAPAPPPTEKKKLAHDPVCACGGKLSEHDKVAPHGMEANHCLKFDLSTAGAHTMHGPTPMLKTRRDPPCGCGAVLSKHDKTPPHACAETGCGHFDLLR